MLYKKYFEQILTTVLDISIHSINLYAVGGGSVNETYQLLVNNNLKFFCKINSATKLPLLFEKEKNGLKLLNDQHIIRIPKIIACETIEDKQILILEWIEQGLQTQQFWKTFGEQLAQLHFITNETFGLAEDNYMGALSQSNAPSNEWIGFFIHQRLEPQIRLAADTHLLEHKHAKHFENLYSNLKNIFSPEKPSLLHGDLWSGNFLAGDDDQPVLIDPAVYFGHRSMDLGMTTLFGGFEQGFYEAYHYHYPLPVNHRLQWDICNLYPLLIHLNLFGKSYLGDIVQIIKNY
jgi:protein-ribulosamine 3-kinase